MTFEFVKSSYETAFDIYKQSERLKDNLLKTIVDEFLVMLKEECLKRNLVFISLSEINPTEILYSFSVNVSGVDIMIDFSSSKQNQRKRIKNALNKIRKIVYPVVAISSVELLEAKKLGLVFLDTGNIGYVKSENYYGKFDTALAKI